MTRFDFIDQLPAEWHSQIQEYLRGERRKFVVKITETGTDFQKSVWQAIRNIPYGQTRSYAQVAAAVGHPCAVRAVGSARCANPKLTITPRHRAVVTHGFAGFAFGLAAKRALLDLEAKQKTLKNK